MNTEKEVKIMEVCDKLDGVEKAFTFEINRYMDELTREQTCVTVDTKQRDIINPKEQITKFHRIEIDITCGGICGNRGIIPASSNKGFTRLDIFKLISKSWKSQGYCDHRWIESVKYDGRGHFKVEFGS